MTSDEFLTISTFGIRGGEVRASAPLDPPMQIDTKVTPPVHASGGSKGDWGCAASPS